MLCIAVLDEVIFVNISVPSTDMTYPIYRERVELDPEVTLYVTLHTQSFQFKAA